MSQQTPEAGHEKLVANRFGVMTQYIPLRQEQDCYTKILSQHYQSLSQHNPRKSLENRS